MPVTAEFGIQMTDILDNYVTTFPTPQNALDIFKGHWSSRLPGTWSSLAAGTIPLFEDQRVTWAIESLGGVEGKTVLELGPLEGGHSYMLENAGAKFVIAIEGNTEAFLRCLVVKEILGLMRVRFLCGDFRKYIAEGQDQFDVVFASGVLYHMTDPVQLLIDISRRTQRLFLWTHYFDATVVAESPEASRRLGPAQHLQIDGFQYEASTYSYQNALQWGGFCGGSARTATWLTKESILRALRHVGFNEISIEFDQPKHPHGPCFAIVARH